jgi:hypothetical protein
MTSPAVGDTVLLQSYLINTRVYGVVVPGSSTQEFTATYEIQGDQGTLTMAAVVGPQGPAGASMFLLSLQNDGVEDPADLPQNLTNSTADIGKTWLFDDIDANDDIIGTSAYVWYGTTYRRLMFGSPGPPGPVPIITPGVDLIQGPGNSFVATGGTDYEPTMTFTLAVPPGPQGTAGALALCPDVDFTSNPPEPGDVLGFTGSYLDQDLPQPTNLAVVLAGSGSLTGTFYWVATATNAAGETTASNEVFLTLTSESATLTWTRVNGATGYNIYRGTGTGAENKLITHIGSGATVTYTDTGAAGSTQSPPGSNTAAVQYPIWVPVALNQLLPSPYSMPEAAFSAFTGISQQAPIGSFTIPPQPFPWTPIVWGHIGAFGLELSVNPLLIGCEVLLGNPTGGTMIARGFGNSLGEVNIMPHYSTPYSPAVALSPNNGLAVVPANNTNPAESTIYVNLYNDGELGLYVYNPTDSQIFIMVMPVSG